MNKKKLLKEERTINVYKKIKGKFLEDAVTEINIDFIPLEFLQEIIVAIDDDPLLYNAYDLNKEQIDKLNPYLEKQIVPDFKRFEYWLECYGIYDWNK